MAKYLKRGILCLMAFVALITIFSRFLSEGRTFIEIADFLIERRGFTLWKILFDNDQIWFYYARPERGFFYILAGFDRSVDIRMIYPFEGSFMYCVFVILSWLELLGGLGLCVLAVKNLLSGDGVLGKILVFGALAIAGVYFIQGFVYHIAFYRSLLESYIYMQGNSGDINKFDLFRQYFHNNFSFNFCLPLIINGILAVGYFFMEKMMPEAE
ncbi:MAG: hypothetical protein IJA15_00080 [Clostridia bacterium]|nr:hypothetical protein [Clostridia bacterium]